MDRRPRPANLLGQVERPGPQRRIVFNSVPRAIAADDEVMRRLHLAVSLRAGRQGIQKSGETTGYWHIAISPMDRVEDNPRLLSKRLSHKGNQIASR